MEPTDWLGDNELLQFFRRNKTEMSCMENPQTFLRQLRDHDLVLEERYQKVSHMQSIKNIKKGLYEILDWLERKQPQHIRAFWSCVFKDTILNEYPTLRLLRNDLMNGTFQSDIKQSVRAKTEEAHEGKRKAVSEDEEEAEKQESSVKKKRKLKNRDVCDEEEEQPGPSSRVTPRKRPEKIHFSSPLKKGEKNGIWTWDLYKSQLPVTCGEKEGILSRKRLADGDKCIAVGRQWFSPGEFERFAGKDSSKNWKRTIKCLDTTLGKLIQADHLKAGNYRGGLKWANILRIHKVRCDCKQCKPGSKDLDDEKNDDECFICKTEEEEEDEFVMCDTCPRSFHKKCHLPHVEDNIIGDGSQWMCTFCVYKANENLYPNESEREALSRPISQRLLHCQYLLLCLRSADKDQIFASNPCGLERYSSVIKKPMWLDNVAGKLQKKLYQTVGEFVSDVQLIFSNSASYNQGNAGYLAMGNRLKELFDKELNSVFNISEQTVG